MIDLYHLQSVIRRWSDESFGVGSSWHKLLGVMEEVGELCHHVLKREQGIRVDQNHNEEVKDAVGDIVIYLMDFCAREGISLEECIETTWTKVQQRTKKDQLHRKESSSAK